MRVGMIGCSGPSHVAVRRALPTWQALRDKIGCEVVALCSETQETYAKDLAKFHGLQHFSDPAALLRSRDIDTVYIAKRGVDHLPLAIRALSQGKNVLVEKPLILPEGGDQLEILKLSRLRGLKCAVNHTFMGSPLRDVSFLRRLNLVSLGRIQFITVSLRSGGRWFDSSDDWHWRPELGGGVARDLAPHALTICYLLRSHTDPARWTVGYGDGIKELNVIGRTESNTYLALDLSWGGNPSQEVNVQCETGDVAIRMFPNRWEIYRNGVLDFEHPVDLNEWWKEVFSSFASGTLLIQQGLPIELEANKIYRVLNVYAQTV